MVWNYELYFFFNDGIGWLTPAMTALPPRKKDPTPIVLEAGRDFWSDLDG